MHGRDSVLSQYPVAIESTVALLCFALAAPCCAKAGDSNASALARDLSEALSPKCHAYDDVGQPHCPERVPRDQSTPSAASAEARCAAASARDQPLAALRLDVRGGEPFSLSELQERSLAVNKLLKEQGYRSLVTVVRIERPRVVRRLDGLRFACAAAGATVDEPLELEFEQQGTV
jgi:hypothetical protein